MNFKILILTTTFVFLAGCETLNSKQNSKISTPLNQIVTPPKINEKQTLILISNSNKNMGTLITDDNWESASFTDSNKKTYNLTRAISADGIKLNNGPIVIHFKGNQGILEKNSIVTHFLIK